MSSLIYRRKSNNRGWYENFHIIQTDQSITSFLYITKDKHIRRYIMKKIKSLIEFLEILEKYPKKRGSSSLYYRGHNSHEYILQPSLFRRNGHIKNEHIMFKEILKDRPDEFSEDKSTLEKLVKMQHFGLPTRLLDITKNPLVALYFACTLPDGKIASKKDGEVVVLSIDGKRMKYSDSDTVMILSNLCKLKPNEKKFDTNLTLEEFNKTKNVNRLVSEIRREKSIFYNEINPKDINNIVSVKVMKKNERIQVQDGLFLLFGIGNENSKLKIDYNDPDWIAKPNERIIVEASAKSKIIRQLEEINISKKTLFPGLESTADVIKRRY